MKLHHTAMLVFLLTSLSVSSSPETHPTIQRLCEPYDDATPCHDLMRTTMQPELLTALTHILSDLDSCINKTVATETSLIKLLYTGHDAPARDSAAHRNGNACVQLHVEALAEFMGAVQELQVGRLADVEARAKSGVRLHEECDHLGHALPVSDGNEYGSLKDATAQVKAWVDNVVAVHQQSKKILDSYRDHLPARV